jgi:hypothetical protein
MIYIDRRFLFPVVAATAWAQQPSPAAAEAEAAVRMRADQFFQLQVDKKYRQGESMVADDTKDYYYNNGKFNIKSFSIERVELLDDNTRAKVTIKAKVTLVTPNAPPMDFDAPLTTLWKVEDGKWVWYFDAAVALETPFGKIKPGSNSATSSSPLSMAGKVPDLASLRALVKIDRNSVELIPDGPPQTVAVSNDLPGGVDLELRSDRMTGMSAQLEKKHLEAGEKTVIYFRASTGSEGAGLVRLMVSPVALQLDIRVKIN